MVGWEGSLGNTAEASEFGDRLIDLAGRIGAGDDLPEGGPRFCWIATLYSSFEGIRFVLLKEPVSPVRQCCPVAAVCAAH